MPVPSMGSDGVIESTVVCESELAYLHDTNTRHGEFHDISVEDFLKEIGNKELFKYDLLMRKAMEIITK